jgi:hemerythrin
MDNKTQTLSLHKQYNDPEHQDLVNMLNNMVRASMEGDEKSYEAFYFRAMEMLDELNKELCEKAGFEE